MRLLLVWLCLAPLLARAQVLLVDRVAAAVDLHAITRSSVEARARPLVVGSKTEAQKEGARRAALMELIEEQLIRQEAQRLGIEVRDEEVDKALQEVAKQNELTVVELFAEIKRQGLEAAQYQAMLRAKLLELRWLNQRMNHAAMPTEETARVNFMVTERARLLEVLRSAAVIEVRL